ncbi:M1 family metallopeptidase [Mucilaginibacter sp. RS28]|uniref:Aminopeptidase N n=1 Tax=Mucilaginibacter straminoryzae TaxID=2932774 RepID=A0A9X1X6Z7_9SPHI|nr:M1 family metallopeptidase [Mucilaginibacter straminoryzae]MCJ8211300.1 M1 family metallopeptidase [Mucilaginibacter straminoryzae]
MFKFIKVPALIGVGLFILNAGAFAQLPGYQNTPEKINDLVHTKLDVRFDYKKRYLYGKEWVTIKPHFYPTDSLRLDAKGMDIHALAVVKNGKNIPLKYVNDKQTLAIKLDKTYASTENYTIYIDYTSKPDELTAHGSAAINDAKGLYFINPDSTVKGKPVQIWTQGETESNSAWFPTIDKPNQKTTEELTMTVPAKYVTLSNGKLVSQKRNTDGTRTDTWKMDKPHSPYLFMMAVGDFRIYHDKWRDKEVNYYLEPKYAPYAKDIFGFTPEVMDFYSKILGVDYPWNKYSQIVVRDYVSGAMENTTATLHGEQVQLTKRELIDGGAESTIDIVHELFHQWFGDYVTAESWSNLTVNESFADLSETLWMEHKYGMDAGNEYNYHAMETYLSSLNNYSKPLVRFNYEDKEEVFDAVTYQKGGRILNMLRHYLGNDAFYKGLNIYLKTNAYKNAEAQQLRLALEEASGKDLNWFFNQWYYRAGHPILTINYQWDDAAKTQKVFLQQTQEGDAFVLPLKVDIYTKAGKQRKTIWMNSKSDTLSFALTAKPQFVNVDADKVLLCTKIDNKTDEEYAYQYLNGPLYLDRHEALEALAPHQEKKEAQMVVTSALNDKYDPLKIEAIKLLNLNNDNVRNVAVPILTKLAQETKSALVQAAALNKLAALKAAGNLNLFKNAVSSQSYAVEAAALSGIYQIDQKQGITYAKQLAPQAEGPLTIRIATIYAETGQNSEWPFVYNHYVNGGREARFELFKSLTQMTAATTNPADAQNGIREMIAMGNRYRVYGYNKAVASELGKVKEARLKLNDTDSARMAEEGIKEMQ